MKLNNIHMIIILVSAIIFSAIFGPDLLEGMSETKQDEKYSKHYDHSNSKQINMKKMWKGTNLHEKRCKAIDGAVYIGNMTNSKKKSFVGCEVGSSCCQPNYIHSGNKKHKKRKKHKKNKKHKKHLYSRDSLSEPTGMSGYKQELVNQYNNKPYNRPVSNDSDSDYDSDYQAGDYANYNGSDSGSDNGSDSGSDGGYGSDNGSDGGYGSDSNNGYGYNSMQNSTQNPMYPVNRVPGGVLPPIQQQQQQQQQGISGSEIPLGSEDQYILKSEIVPPVCPACPTVTDCPGTKKARPCPPCARCPEPSFHCKKVPTYTKTNSMLPMPMLNDFSKF